MAKCDIRRRGLASLLGIALAVSAGPFAVGAFDASPARAATNGQCNTNFHRSGANNSQWLRNLQAEGVTPQAVSRIFRPAGFVPVDQSLKQWMAQRVMTGKTAKAFSGQDFGCRGGHMFNAGRRSYARGKGVKYVLPKKFSKRDVRVRRTKTYTRAITVRVRVIGLPDCSNPFSAWAYVRFFVHSKKVVHRTPARPVHPVVPSTPVTPPPNNTVVNICSPGANGTAGNGNTTSGGNNNGGSCNTTVIVVAPPPPPPPPARTVVHSCAASVGLLAKDERTATFSVDCDGPIASATWVFSGNGRTVTGTTVTNTFPDSEAGKTATGTVRVLFTDGAASVSETVGIDIPETPPNGNTAPPPPPAG